MPIDPATMTVNLPGEVISTDRPCMRCKYNLRGLEVGGACPECGTAITSAKKSVRFADNLVDAPIGYIKLMAVGLGLQAGIVVTVAFLFIVGWAGGVAAVVAPLLFTGAGVLWFAAAWIVTMERPSTERIVRDEILDSERLRRVIRYTQGIGPAAAFVAWLGVLTGSGLIMGLAALLLVSALGALVPLGIYLSAFADWAGETGEGSRLRAATWCLAVGGTLSFGSWLVLQVNPPFSLLFNLFFIVALVVVVVGVLLFAWSVCVLAKAAGWAIHNSGEAMEREIRMAEKKRRRAMRDAARAHSAAAAFEANAPAPPEAFADDPGVIPFDGAPADRAGSETGTRVDAVAPGGQTGRAVPVDSARERLSDPDDHSQAYELAPED